MKFISLFLGICMACPLFAKSPFGFIREYAPKESVQQTGRGLSDILNGRTLTIYIMGEPCLAKSSVAKDIIPQHTIEKAILEQQIEQALNSWFTNLETFIQTSRRETEFTDILQLVKTRRPKLHFVDQPQQADLIVKLAEPKELGEHILGQFLVTQHELAISCAILPEERMPVFTHELGHFLGLSDQYTGVENAYFNSSALYSTSDRVDGKNSIMAIEDKLGCDDADGLINLIDYTLASRNKGTYSARARRGWKSFCDQTIFQKAKVLHRQSYQDLFLLYLYDSKGNIRQEIDPFIPKSFVKYYIFAEQAQVIAFLTHLQQEYLFFASRTEEGDWITANKTTHIDLSERFCRVTSTDLNKIYFRAWEDKHQEEKSRLWHWDYLSIKNTQNRAKKIPLGLFMSRTNQNQWTCFFHLDDTNAGPYDIPLITYRQNQTEINKQEKLNSIQKKYQLTAQAIKTAGQEQCQRAIQNMSDLQRHCELFVDAEQKYQNVWQDEESAAPDKSDR